MTRRSSDGGWTLTPIAEFKGLNLVDQPEGIAPNEALDIANVELTDRGSLRRRDGYSRIAAAMSAAVTFIGSHRASSSVRQLIVGHTTRLRAIAADGTSLGEVVRTAPTLAQAQFGATGTTHSYFTNGVDGWARWDGAVWSSPTWSSKAFVGGAVTAGQAAHVARCVGVWSGEERLLLAGLAAFPDRVLLSDNANALQFTDVNFITLGAGDGERFQGIHSWREMVFIFKESKYWVLTGSTTDANGVTVFQRRPVNIGIGPSCPSAVCVGRDGVYFANRDGIYRTRGGDPELLTRTLSPLWGSPGAPYYTGGFISTAAFERMHLRWLDERLFLSFDSDQGSGADTVLVMGGDGSRASIWKLPANSLGVHRINDRDELYFGESVAAGGVFGLGRQAYGLLTDAGAPFSTKWLGGFFTPAQERVVRTRRISVLGQGVFDVGLAADYSTTIVGARVDVGTAVDSWGDGVEDQFWGDGGNDEDVWGSGGALALVLVDVALRGSRLALACTSNPATAGDCKPWSMTRAVLHLAGNGPRAPAVTRGTP